MFCRHSCRFCDLYENEIQVWFGVKTASSTSTFGFGVSFIWPSIKCNLKVTSTACYFLSFHLSPFLPASSIFAPFRGSLCSHVFLQDCRQDDFSPMLMLQKCRLKRNKTSVDYVVVTRWWRHLCPKKLTTLRSAVIWPHNSTRKHSYLRWLFPWYCGQKSPYLF